MKSQFKYGLKNASAYLQEIRREKCTQSSMNDQIHQRTFEQEEIPQSRVTMYEPKSQLITFNKGVELTDLIMRQSLKNILDVYKGDLKQLQENRQNLIESIEQLSNKIQSFSDLQEKNKMLELENFKQKKQLEGAIRQYHKKKLEITHKKLKQHENFLRQKQKIKTLLDFCPEDHGYAVEIDSWKKYKYDLLMNSRFSQDKQMMDEKKILEQIFKKKVKVQKDEKKGKKKIESEGLLGDLKMFAKNFKMPSQMPNQV